MSDQGGTRESALPLRGFAARACAVLVLVSCVGHAQQPKPLPTPNLDIADGGRAFSVLRLADGSVIVGGLFDSVFDPGTQLSLERKNLARFKPDGALDLAWNPAPNSSVFALAAGANGRIYAGGAFSSIGGLARQRLARLQAGGTGQVDADWNPAADAFVHAIVEQPNVAVYVGGTFANVGNAPRLRVAKLDVAGSGDSIPGWNPGVEGSADAVVDALALDAGGNLLVGGRFDMVGGLARTGAARVSGAGVVDPTWNPSSDGYLYDIAIAASGDVYVAGYFSQIGGRTRTSIAKLSSLGAGQADENWNPNAGPPLNVVVRSLALDGAGGLYAGGSFTSIGGQVRRHLAKLSTTGTGAADSAWNAQVNDQVYALSADGASAVYAAGTFTRAGGTLNLGLARLAVGNGASTIPYAVQSFGYITDIAVAPDHSIYAAGAFARAGVYPRAGLLRVAPNGGLDTAWDPSPDGDVYALAVDGDGAVYVGGGFQAIGGQARSNLAKLAPSGTGAADADWNPAPDASVSAISPDPGGSIFVAGYFTAIGNQSRACIAKLGDSGVADATWNPLATAGEGARCNITALALGPGDTLYAGGDYTDIGGQPRSRLARLSRSGAGQADAQWNPGADDFIETIAIGPAGEIYVGGGFGQIGGQPRTSIAKLSPTGIGAADPTWNPAPAIEGGGARVETIAAYGPDALFVGGYFQEIGGAPRYGLAKLSSTGTGSADPIWVPEAPISVSSLALDGSGTLVIGGSFNAVAGVPRRYLASLPTVVSSVFADSFESP